MPSLISLSDVSDADLRSIVARALKYAEGLHSAILSGRIVGTYFRHTSTRTRTAFSAGAMRLGASVISYGPDDMQLVTGETANDTGRVLSGMIDVLVARTSDSTNEMRQFADQDRMSVVNAMSAAEHPTQAVADLVTLQEHFGRLNDLRVLYLGEGNSTATALASALARQPGVRLDLRTPWGYGLPKYYRDRVHELAKRSGASVCEHHDMTGIGTDVDVIYTTRWQTTGTTKRDPRWRDVFAPFQVTDALWDRNPSAIFLHDLPAHRGQEVTADVLEGAVSHAFRQAEHKMFSAMAVLEWCCS